MSKNKGDIRFIRKGGRIIPIRQKTAKLHISGERLKIVDDPLKHSVAGEKSVFRASYFKPSKTFLGRLFDTHSSKKDYEFMRRHGLRIESVDGKSVFVRSMRGKKK